MCMAIFSTVLTNLEGENFVIPELVAIAWNLCETEARETAGSCLGSVNPALEKREKMPRCLAHESNFALQYNLSNTDTHGTKIIVLISEVSSSQGE